MKEKVQTMEIIPAEVARKRTDTALTARRLHEIMVKISRRIQETAKGEYHDDEYSLELCYNEEQIEMVRVDLENLGYRIIQKGTENRFYLSW